jgi:phosphoglycolate phosphatase/pyrophosphatase PpaX
MPLKYKCLILDHDDTAVNSTATIHYPAHREVMRRLRPGCTPVSLHEWWLKNFEPGLMEYLTGELCMTEEEVQMEYLIWREYTTTRIPDFYPGFLEALSEYKKAGGVFSVVSHSEVELIERDYSHGAAGLDLFPDLIFGWDFDASKRKPSPWPVEESLGYFGVSRDEALIVDDLKPGVLMSQATGVPAAAAGWSHDIPEIRTYMEAQCVTYFHTVEQFRSFILASSR